jgi:DNA modification methylase
VKRKFYDISSATSSLFAKEMELLPSVTELFEIEMAHLEKEVLNESDFIDRTAFFKSFNGQLSKHFLLYSKQPNVLLDSGSSATQNYFENGQFATGYATHSLFPYRGKFHPQLIKGIINIIGIQKGETILDPMCGSGTLNIEAALMGIHSYGADISPFCQFMTDTKYEALNINQEILQEHTKNPTELFELFNNKGILNQLKSKFNTDEFRVYQLSLLAFLDSMGYAKRVQKSNHKQLFPKVLKRYVETVETFISNPHFKTISLGTVQVLKKSEALNIELENNTVDGVITSPPYSFAIDYAENDEDQLEFLGYNVNHLREKMIGLKGKGKSEKLSNYFSDMELYCSEIARVLKKGKYFVMIIGSNTNQTGGIRLEDKIITSASKNNLKLVKSMIKPIKGMRSTMKDEYILYFEKC